MVDVAVNALIHSVRRRGRYRGRRVLNHEDRKSEARRRSPHRAVVNRVNLVNGCPHDVHSNRSDGSIIASERTTVCFECVDKKTSLCYCERLHNKRSSDRLYVTFWGSSAVI